MVVATSFVIENESNDDEKNEDTTAPEVPDTGFFGGIIDRIKAMPIIATITIASIIVAASIFGVKTARRSDKVTKMKK
jgi:hypothetical protein